MKIKIKKGRHYPYLIPIAFPFRIKRFGFSKGYGYRVFKFKFTESCLFDLHDEDQHDVNKLFGFSIGHHHKGSSFRFGWRPILKERKIEIVAYEYHDGVRQKTMPICRVDIDKWLEYTIIYDANKDKSIYYVGDVEFRNHFVLKKKYGCGYTLGVYFGGNEKAPQDITIQKKK